MYIIELIAKLMNKKEPEKTSEVEETDYEDICGHTFYPIDSTNETLACSKCGFVIKNDPDKVKPKNPFSI